MSGLTPGPWLGIAANGGGPTIKVGSKWMRATPADVAAMKASPEMLEALKAAKELVEWFMQHSRQADHAHEELGQSLHETTGWKELVDSGYNGLMASYGEQFDAAIAKAAGTVAA
ncbi:hypothetical protein [Zavarzinella formosa]|uniref:hypothetical protein n=1 Tax=Zavarzinella formosa TaxID=360055 RepID=UPI000366D34B|nr:hypothetical protein [Zavarzinella formosa]